MNGGVDGLACDKINIAKEPRLIAESKWRHEYLP